VHAQVGERRRRREPHERLREADLDERREPARPLVKQRDRRFDLVGRDPGGHARELTRREAERTLERQDETRTGAGRNRLFDDRSALEHMLHCDRHGEALLVGQTERRELGQRAQPQGMVQHLHDPTIVARTSEALAIGRSLLPWHALRSLLDPDATPFLSVVIPAYHEQGRIGGTLRTIRAYMSARRLSFELIVAVDGPGDATAAEAREACRGAPGAVLENVRRAGKGHAVRRGMRASRGRFALMTDADLSTPIEDLDRFLPLLDSPEGIWIGSRRRPGAVITRGQGPLRESLGRGFTALANLALGTGASDLTCGFKVFGEGARDRLFATQRIDRWVFDAEVIFLARRFGLPLREVPVSWGHAEPSRVRLLDGPGTLIDLVRIRGYAAAGRYDATGSRP
jgi:dolichyl-phosphate beta-glucosyltransferase